MQRAARPDRRSHRLYRAAPAFLLLSCAALTVRAEPAPAPASPSQAAAPAASQPAAQVKLHDTVVLEFSHGDGLRSAADRARAGTQALVRAFKEGSVETRLERRA